MVTVAVLMSLMINLSSSSVKTTLDVYLKEQAELLARGATEYAILAISGHNNTDDCITDINIAYPEGDTEKTHDINISLSYIGNGMPGCANMLDNTIDTDESNITVIIDTVVSVNQANTLISEPIRVHRRTIQKP